MGIYYYLLLSYELKFLRFQQSKTSVSKRLKNMSAPSPCYVTQTPQREFAGAKVRKKSDICKYMG